MAHQHYTGTGKMHSFRGLLADGKQERIRIQGATGEIAWRITKFQAISSEPGIKQHESILKIYREEQTSVTGTIDFSNDELLAAINYTSGNASTETYFISVVLDNSLFVRNIYITHAEVDGTNSINYYIELEEVKVSAAGMAQLAVAAARRTVVASA